MVRFGRVDRGDAHLCAECTDLLQDPVEMFVVEVEVVFIVDQFGG